MIALCTMLCGGEDCSDKPLFGRAKEPFLRQFLTLKHGIPSHDTFSRVFRLLDPVSAERFGEVARAHWGVENGLHWVLDVTMNEDGARNRKDNGPQNIALLRRLALNLAKLEGSKGSMKGKLKRAGWNDAFLTKLLAAFGTAHMR